MYSETQDKIEGVWIFATFLMHSECYEVGLSLLNVGQGCWKTHSIRDKTKWNGIWAPEIKILGLPGVLETSADGRTRLNKFDKTQKKCQFNICDTLALPLLVSSPHSYEAWIE